MLKYIVLSLFALNLSASVERHDGKPFIKIGPNAFPLELFELTPKAEARLFSKTISNELEAFAAQPSPQTVDLKYRMSDVKGQSVRRSCSAFQAVGLVEQYLDRSRKLSEQCLIYRSTAKDPGDPFSRLHHILSNGIHYQSDCPYVDPSSDKRWYEKPELRESLIQKAVTTIPDLTNKPVATLPANIVYRNVDDMTTTDSVNYVRNKIRTGLPVGISVFVVGNGWNTGLIDTIPTDDEIRAMCPPKAAANSPQKHCDGHGVIITGFDDNRGVFYFKNSWDITWGVNRNYYPELYEHNKTGYGVMSYRYFAKFAIGKLLTLE